MKKLMMAGTFFVFAVVLILFGESGIVFLKIVCSDEISSEMLVDIHSDPFKFPLWKMTRDNLQREMPTMSGKYLGKLIQNTNQFAREQAADEIVKRISACNPEGVIILGKEINRMDVWEVLIAKNISSRIKGFDAIDLYRLSKTPLRDLADSEIHFRISNGTMDPKIFQMFAVDHRNNS